jgi:tetratricopeptide (TPR) repeat protein
VYAAGVSPRTTPFSQAADRAIAQAQLGLDGQTQYQAALSQARQGIAADSGSNPVHFFVGGSAAAGLGNFVLADSMWTVAERIYPAYELEIEPERENAWGNAFNTGVEAYNNGDAAAARREWTGAAQIYKFRPEAAQNLAILLTNAGDYPAAITSYQQGIASVGLRPNTRVLDESELSDREDARIFMLKNLGELLLFTERYEDAEPVFRAIIAADASDVSAQANLARVLGQLGRASDAAEIYTRLLSSPTLPASELMSIGVALFQSDDFVRAAEVFGRVAQLQPRNRDAWYNQANSLLAAKSWEAIIPIGQRLVEIDPLGSNSALILAQTFRELGRTNDALAALQRAEAYPVWMDQIQLQPGAQQSSVSGEITGNAAAQGTPVRIRFIFFNDAGEIGRTETTITAPAREATQSFTAQVAGQATAYGYEVLN